MTDKDKLEAVAYFAGQRPTGLEHDPSDYPVDYATGMLSDLGIEIQAKSQPTPGAGEEERWEKASTPSFVLGKRLWEIWGKGRLVASRLYEADADLICTLHNERTHLVSRAAYVEMRDAREADQQTIAGLRKALIDARPYVGRLAGGQHVGKVLSQGEAVKLLGRIDKALAAIAATEEGA